MYISSFFPRARESKLDCALRETACKTAQRAKAMYIYIYILIAINDGDGY